MYLLILLIPLISATISGLWGRNLGEKGAGIVTSTLIVLTSVLSWIAFYEVGVCGNTIHIHLFDWIESGMFLVSFGLLYDSLTVVMLIVVTSVSSLVHIYSTGYMSGDPHVPRFMSYLSLFTFFMLILVTSNNLLQLFIGWEGVGLCSYLLINFWYTRIQANKSAMKAMIVNRIGDVGIALAMFVTYETFKTLDFEAIFAASYYISEAKLIADQSTLTSLTIINYEFDRLTLIGILFLIGAAGKSAQMGLHTWLPDAMEGPTPVSALIHAATMVTAGVFLLIRCSPLLEYAPQALVIIAIIGACTAFMAATIGVVQNDIKKVIAYSTCSQLGYMVFACGISNYATSLFHLMNHAFFKALLFLSAGCVIHAMADEQDMRKLGALIKALPFTYSMMLIGSLSLMGFPFLTGYYSKDAILELAYSKYTFEASFGHWLGTISAFFTAFYSFRLIYLTFLTDSNAPLSSYSALPNVGKSATGVYEEAPWNMSIPLLILGFGSIFVGWLFKDMMIGPGTPFFNNAIFVLPANVNIFEAEFLDPSIKFIPVIFSLFGAGIGFLVYHLSLHVNLSSPLFKNLYTFFNSKWFFDFIYNSYVVKPIFLWGHSTSYKILDRGLIEFFGPSGISLLITKLSSFISSLHSGYIYHYAFTIFIFATLFLLGEKGLIWDNNLVLLFPFLIMFFFFFSNSENKISNKANNS
jgi:NADH-ubiquinone oxidoreductase chain 5